MDNNDDYPRNFAAVNDFFDRLEWLNMLEDRFGLPRSSSVRQAARALAALHMNIWDVVEGRDIRHASRSALRRYTRRTGRFFPLERAKSEGLRAFLIHFRD
jgi:hypothetical protein